MCQAEKARQARQKALPQLFAAISLENVIFYIFIFCIFPPLKEFSSWSQGFNSHLLLEINIMRFLFFYQDIRVVKSQVNSI